MREFNKMQKELWIVYFESANYCGYGQHCLVWATDEDDARDQATSYAYNYYFEEDGDQVKEDAGWEEDSGEDFDDTGMEYANIVRVYPLASDQAEDIRGYLLDETQKSFYPIIN